MSNDHKVRTRRRPGRHEPHEPVWLDNDRRRKAFKGTCPECKAPIVAMSDIQLDLPTTHVNKGDVIRCDRCETHLLVAAVNPCNQLQLQIIPVRRFLD